MLSIMNVHKLIDMVIIILLFYFVMYAAINKWMNLTCEKKNISKIEFVELHNSLSICFISWELT